MLCVFVPNLFHIGFNSYAYSKEGSVGFFYSANAIGSLISVITPLLIENDKKDNSSDIYSKFEKEFGRTLSPVEYETISKWIESNIPLELIEAALKEAILSGVNSIRYIDKILFEWNKKGYKTSSDIINKSKKDEYIEEIYDYDWLNE